MTPQEKADKLAGRPVEVEELENGKFIALWLSFGKAPPKAGSSKEEALENLVQHLGGTQDGTTNTESGSGAEDTSKD